MNQELFKEAVALINDLASGIEALGKELQARPDVTKEASVATREMIKAGLAEPEDAERWQVRLAEDHKAALDTLAKVSQRVGRSTTLGTPANVEGVKAASDNLHPADKQMFESLGIPPGDFGPIQSLL